MKIAICLYKYFPYGGLQRDFLRIANTLIHRGHSVRVYTQKWIGETCPSNMELVIVPVHSLTNHGKSIQFHKWVQKHLENNPVDRIVGFNKMPDLDVYYGADVCYAEKVDREKSWFYKLGARYKILANFERLTVGKGLKTKLMIITPNQQKDFQKHYQTESERFYLLPPGISKDRKYENFKHNLRETFRNSFFLSDSDFLLLQIGSDFQRKGVDRSIIALAALPPELQKRTFLYVVGQDNSKKFERLAKKLEVTKQVRFFGGRDDIPSFIAGADLFLHPARSENTGTVILEALVGGLPEIVTEVCGYAPYVVRAQSGLVIADPFVQAQYNSALLSALDRQKLMKWKQNACYFADHEDLYSLPEKAADIILE